MDAVSDRDFVIELLSANSITAIHLSRIAEEWVLWATEEFGFLTPSDRVSTGSSIMPQKKNPDPMELARGKSARVVGDLMTMLVLCKGLPLAYNRDLQVSHQRGCCYYIICVAAMFQEGFAGWGEECVRGWEEGRRQLGGKGVGEVGNLNRTFSGTFSG